MKTMALIAPIAGGKVRITMRSHNLLQSLTETTVLTLSGTFLAWYFWAKLATCAWMF